MRFVLMAAVTETDPIASFCFFFCNPHECITGWRCMVRPCHHPAVSDARAEFPSMHTRTASRARALGKRTKRQQGMAMTALTTGVWL